MRVLAMASQKGGSGKTTLSGHLAVQAQLAGAGPVVLIDIDPQGSLSDWWNERQSEFPAFAQTTVARLAADLEVLRQQGVAPGLQIGGAGGVAAVQHQRWQPAHAGERLLDRGDGAGPGCPRRDPGRRLRRHPRAPRHQGLTAAQFALTFEWARRPTVRPWTASPSGRWPTARGSPPPRCGSTRTSGS